MQAAASPDNQSNETKNKDKKKKKNDGPLGHSWLVRYGKRLRKPTNRILVKYSKVGDPPVYPAYTFDWQKDIEANWQAIRDEALAVLSHRSAVPVLREVSPDHDRIAVDEKWQSYFLWGYGYRMHMNCDRCPQTAKIVERIPGLRSAFFSIHAPHLHIPRHKGVTKGMLTCHLGLAVPKERSRCRMMVEDQELIWEEGKSFVFDDTYHHEVWNDTDDDRVILLVQFDRPLRFPGNLLYKAFMRGIRWSPFVQDAKRNVLKWDKAYSESEAKAAKDQASDSDSKAA